MFANTQMPFKNALRDGDRYSGTWQHGRVGGHMSGRIEKQGAE